MALWGLLGAKLIAGWGVAWDIQWHLLIGRDSFWIPPHVMTYAGVTLAVALSFGVLGWETWRAAPGAGRARGDTRRLFGLTGTRGFHLAAWGIAITVLAAPIDDLWHRLFGLDVTLWSPPHLMGILGSVLNSLACLAIAREVYEAGTRVRLVAILLAGGFLYGTLHLTVEPSMRIAYVYGGARFYTYAMLAALLLPLALVATARLSGQRWAPVLLLLGLIPMALAGRQIERAGFALLRPVSVIEEEIAKDPTSPIAVAHEIARKNGTPPGRPVGLLTLLALVPALVMGALDARGRPVLATLGYAVTLFAATGAILAGRPAFQPLIPGAGGTSLAVLLTIGAAIAGGWTAGRLSERLIGGSLDGARRDYGTRISSTQSTPVHR